MLIALRRVMRRDNCYNTSHHQVEFPTWQGQLVINTQVNPTHPSVQRWHMVCQEKELLTSTLVINWNYPNGNGMICNQIRVQIIKLISIQLFNNETPCEVSRHTPGSWSCESRLVLILTCVWTCFIHWKLIPWFISKSHEFFRIQTKITWQTWR